MSEWTPKKRFLDVLALKKVDRVPVLSVTQTGTLDQMKATGAHWPKAHREAKLMAELAVAGHTLCGFEAVRLPFGLTGEAATMGCEIDYHEERSDFTPSVKKALTSTENLVVAEPTEGIMGQILEASKIVREKVGDELPIIAGVTGPFTITGHLRGVDQVMKDLILNPQAVHNVQEVTCQIVTRFGKALHENGVDAIALIEPNASIIGPTFFKKFVSQYMAKVVAGINAPTIMHTCGNSMPIMNLMIDTGVNGVSVDQKVNVGKAKAVIQGRAAIIGNVDPVSILLEKRPEDVVADCKRIMSEGTNVLAPGCGLSPYTPLDNIKAMVRVGKAGKI
jgi:MtaA/CmuA family methyltransferase